MYDSLWPHALQHARLPCPSPSPRVCSNSCPLSWWCHPTILSSPIPSPSALNLSQHQALFQWVGSLPQVARVLEGPSPISSSSEYSSLISFRTDWFDLTMNFGKFLKRWESQMWSHTRIQILERTHSLSSLRTWRGDFSLYTFLYFWFLNQEMKSIKNFKNNWKREKKKQVLLFLSRGWDEDRQNSLTTKTITKKHLNHPIPQL